MRLPCRAFFAVLLLCFGISAPSATYAQNPSQTGILTGLVADPSGAVIPGAVVHVETHKRSKFAQPNTTTDATGHYTLTLPPGAYDVTIVYPGFTPFVSTAIARAGITSHLDAALAIATESEQVNVTAGTSTSAVDNKSALVFGTAELQTFSDDDATFQQQLQAIAGGDPTQPSSVYVDGFSGGQIPPKDSIREVRINQNPYSAQFQDLGFGRIEIFTKPGSDKLHGHFMAFSNDSALNTQNPFAGPQPPYYMLVLRGNLNGPIGKKTSFFVNGFYNKQQNNSVINAAATQSSAAPFITTISSPTLSGDFTVRLDRQITPNNILTARYEVNHVSLTNGLAPPQSNNGPSVQAVPQTLQSEAFNNVSTTQTLQLSDSQNIGKNKIVETRFQYIRSRSNQDPVSNMPTVIVEGYFNGGGSSAQALHDSTDRIEFQEYVSIAHGQHFFRFGGRYRSIRDANLNTANYNGVFTFPDYATYAAAKPTPANPSGGPGATQFNITTGQSSAVVLTGDLGLYADDEWKARKNLTLNFGFRLESQSAIPDHFDPAPRIGASWAIGQTDKRPAIVTLRSGFGLFYDRFSSGNILTAIRQQSGSIQPSYYQANPSFFCETSLTACSASIAALSAAPPTIYNIDPHLRSEYYTATGLTAERTIGKIGTVTANYLHLQGDHQWISRNINAPLPGTFIYGTPNSGVRPLGGTQNIYQFSSNASSTTNMIFANTQLHPTKNINLWAFLGNRYKNADSGGATSFPTNQYHVAADYGRVASATFRLFTGADLKLPLGLVADPFVAYLSRQPFNITTGTDLNGDTQYNDRPSFATAASPAASVYKTAYGTFNASPQPGERIIPINYGNGPRFFYTELGLRKVFHFGPLPAVPPAPAAKPGPNGKLPPPPPPPPRPYDLSFSVEGDNLFNHTNRASPVGVLTSPQFGQSLSLGSVFGGSPNANRTISLGAFFNF
jgi:hypothetical protein